MTKNTIVLTDAEDDEAIVFVWRNITHFYDSHAGTSVHISTQGRFTVKETVAEVMRLIEEAPG